MTTVTDVGLEWFGDRALSDSPDVLDTIALGTGTNEAQDAQALENKIYDASKTNSNVEFVETGATGEFEAIITVKGGTQVPANTDITEIGVFAGDPDNGGVLVTVDEFAAVTVEDGHTEEFTVPVNPTR